MIWIVNKKKVGIMGLYDFPWSKEKQQQAQELEWGAEPAQGSEKWFLESCNVFKLPERVFLHGVH